MQSSTTQVSAVTEEMLWIVKHHLTKDIKILQVTDRPKSRPMWAPYALYTPDGANEGVHRPASVFL